MWRMRFFIAGLIGVLTGFGAWAGDIPDPVKKPRDKTGAVLAKPTVPQSAPLSPAVPQSAPLSPAVPQSAPLSPAADKPAAAKPAQLGRASKDPPKASTKVPSKVQTNSAPPPAKAGPEAKKQSADTAAKPLPVPAPPTVPTAWTDVEVQEAKARCNVVLATLDAETVPEPPFRDGDCGAPAAVRVTRIGKSPGVVLDPPPLLTCDMVGALHTWLKQNVQPLAKKHLGSNVVKIETMSDYSCRNAYGRTNGKLSEHGLANALDIRGFVTSTAQTAYVLESWGPTQRDIAAREAAIIAAAKAAAEQEAARTTAAAAAAAVKAAPAAVANSAAPLPVAKGSIVDGLPVLKSAKRPPSTPALGTALGFEPSRLGGPKDKDKDKDKAAARVLEVKTETSPPVPTPPRTSAFLREAHASACRLFGTTLGPEANNAHRNHFHIDMAPRKTTKICD